MAHRPHLVDTTLFFSPTSGGVRRYLLAKHAWLGRHAHLEHTLLVPGGRHEPPAAGLAWFPAPRIPFAGGYRFPWRLGALARALGVPAVAFCHSDLVGLAAARGSRAAARTAATWLRTLYQRADLVLAPSRVVVERLRDAGVAHAVVQPLGVDTATFTPERADPALRRSLGLSPRARLLVFAGRLAPEKNLGELESLVERLGAPYHLLVIGGERTARVSPRITYLGYQREPARLAAWFAGAYALVHAGRCETFGLVALEALACGLPVVAYAAAALPEIVDAEVGALVPPTGPAALAEAVAAHFARDVAPVRAAARARVVRDYTWERVLQLQLRHYARLLHRPTLLSAELALPAT